MKRSVLLLTLLFCIQSVWAHDVEVDGIFYNLDRSNNTASVTYDDDSWSVYSGDVVIPASIVVDGTTFSVTSLGDKCFDWCDMLTSITIPNSVTSFGEYCFNFCTGLTSITIPNSVTSLED
ncbi:MAG: leucine-rich repeat domain-containing protein, partial [Lepagella sp.]